ncbi:MAG: class I SAM-dependent methyltransferase [Rhodospirillaceae bacterium]|nr:class I SAM-dependent methyltransferase [Rhodospirillaceae bacterium]
MPPSKSIVPASIADYLDTVAQPEPDALAELRAATAAHPQAGYQLDPDGGRVLRLLTELIGARRTLEVGTFTGYSALAMALAMGPDGQVVTIDIDSSLQDIATTHWKKAGVVAQITAMTGPARDLLDDLILEKGEAGGFDLVFIDADKEGYAGYYEQALVLVRPGGVIAFDNVLWRGRVADPNDSGIRTEALRRLNGMLRDDDRVTAVLLPVGDGLTVARKRA